MREIGIRRFVSSLHPRVLCPRVEKESTIHPHLAAPSFI